MEYYTHSSHPTSFLESGNKETSTVKESVVTLPLSNSGTCGDGGAVRKKWKKISEGCEKRS